ncbi:hypothetical protein CKO44_07820 [Rubrivivax gelatinosus]|uniref:phage baseplate assembly protein V n=1 Tax=Rubrivivax gelatinosus TaxID=28068 RepID=UPI001902DF49|nr:phage baseplate assembly protein V [Rubrivivax gelatinosus]MBK1613376.1 hypothetical protein [Rubrivivax gelatinosus]MBZ8143179.1 baseplate assembly protein [Rubrivivax gelatinosus]
MTWFQALLRRARIRGLTEAVVQRGRAESTQQDAKDGVERWQDYGFAAQPVDGQGLVLNVGGHTIILRCDRIGERPNLAAFEVSVWHREGHRVTLKDGRLVHVECDELVVDASTRVRFNTPRVEASAAVDVGTALTAGESCAAPAVAASASLKVQGKEMHQHAHGSVSQGHETSGPPV